MKKLLVLTVLTCMLLSLGVSAADPGLLLDFSAANKDAIEELVAGSADCEWTYEGEDLKVVCNKGPEDGSNGDVYVTYEADYVDCDKYQWIKFRVKNTSDATDFEMHFASDGTGGGVIADACTHFAISSGDTDYKEYVYNIKTSNLESQAVNNVILDESVWSGEATQVRFDYMWKAEPSGQMATGSTMYVDYVGLFESEADAKAFKSTAAAATPAETTVAPAETTVAPAETTVASPAPAESVPVAVADAAPTHVVAPQTSDTAMVLAIVMMLAVVATIAISKKKSHN